MKPLTKMTSRELFCILTGDGSFVQQTMLKNLLVEYKKKYPDRVGAFGEMDLAVIVQEMTQEQA